MKKGDADKYGGTHDGSPRPTFSSMKRGREDEKKKAAAAAAADH